MKTIREIETYVTQKRKQGYDGYQDITKFFSEFSEEELEYIEVSEQSGLKSFKYLYQYKDIATLAVALFSLFISIFPDDLKSNELIFEKLGAGVLLVFAMVILIYHFLEQFSCKNIAKKEYILEVIEKIKSRE